MAKIDKISSTDTLNTGREKINTAIDAIVNSSGNSVNVGFTESFDTLNALKTKYPNGASGMFFVFDNGNNDGGHSYMWVDGAWKDGGVYQATEIAENSVSPDKTTFMDYQEGSLNVLNPAAVTGGWFIDPGTGNFVANPDDRDYAYTDFIPVKEGNVLKPFLNLAVNPTGFRMVAAYDASKKIVASAGNASSSGSYTVPSGIRFIVVTLDSYAAATNKSVMIIRGETLPTKYIEYYPPGFELSEGVLTTLNDKVNQKITKEPNAVTPEFVSFMEKSGGKNNYKVDTLQKGHINPSGGNFTAGTNYWTTDFVDTRGKKFLVSSVYENGVQQLLESRFLAEYDNGKNVISFDPTNHSYLSKLELQPNTRFVRVTYPDSLYTKKIQIEFNDDGMMTEYEEPIDPYYKIKDENMVEILKEIEKIKENGTGGNEVEKSPLYGKKVAWLGSSITQGYGWCEPVNAYFNFSATNCGVGGTTVVYESISSMCTKERLLGQYSNVTDPNTGEVTYNGVAIPSDIEIIFWEGGTNDWARNWPLGSTKEITYDSEGNISLDTSTFYGACHQALKNMTELFPNAIIIAVGTPFGKMPNRGLFTHKYGLINNQGMQSVEYGDALVDICGMWGFPSFNFGRLMRINDNNIATLIPDGLHLSTDEAKKRAAYVIIDELLKIKHI